MLNIDHFCSGPGLIVSSFHLSKISASCFPGSHLPGTRISASSSCPRTCFSDTSPQVVRVLWVDWSKSLAQATFRCSCITHIIIISIEASFFTASAFVVDSGSPRPLFYLSSSCSFHDPHHQCSYFDNIWHFTCGQSFQKRLAFRIPISFFYFQSITSIPTA